MFWLWLLPRRIRVRRPPRRVDLRLPQLQRGRYPFSLSTTAVILVVTVAFAVVMVLAER